MLEIFKSIFIFYIGAIFGSFFCTLANRLKEKEKLFLKRSFCPHCKKILSPKDLIPIFSFFFLKGKCRYCGGKIPLDHLFFEIIEGVLFLFFFYFQIDFSLKFFYLVFFSLFLIICDFDIQYKEIPMEVLIFLFFFSIFFKNSLKNFVFDLIWGILAFLFFYSFHFFSRKKAMGIGDAYLGFLLGFTFGFPKIIFLIYFSFLFGGIYGIFIFFKKRDLKLKVPFSPFLFLGSFSTIFLNKFSNLLSFLYG